MAGLMDLGTIVQDAAAEGLEEAMDAILQAYDTLWNAVDDAGGAAVELTIMRQLHILHQLQILMVLIGSDQTYTVSDCHSAAIYARATAERLFQPGADWVASLDQLCQLMHTVRIRRA